VYWLLVAKLWVLVDKEEHVLSPDAGLLHKNQITN
jgi:hypothetical protein